MTRPVMVALDGSEKDARALPAALAFAELAGAELQLVRVLEASVDALTARAGVLGVSDALAQLRDATRRALDEEAARLGADAPVRVTTEVLEGADVAGTLLANARLRGAHLLVMATRAAGPVGRALGGSVADRVAHDSTLPVVLVPPGGADYRDRRVELRRVLVPLDGSALARQVIDHLLAFERSDLLELVLCEVVSPPMLDAAALLAPPPRVAGLAREADPFGEAPGAPDQHAEAARRLESVAAALRERGVAVETRVEEAERPADAICAAVRGSLADFVAMASRGQRGIERALLGSTAEGVVRHSDVPVLLVTPAAGAL